MQRRFTLKALSVAAALGALAASAQALTVFTCEPEWAALVRQLAPGAKAKRGAYRQTAVASQVNARESGGLALSQQTGRDAQRSSRRADEGELGRAQRR